MKKDDIIMKEQAKKVAKKSGTIRGLCFTCNNAGYCSFRASEEDRLIYYCELFDCFVEADELVEVAKRILSSPPVDKGTSKFQGLCMNCTRNTTCTYPKPEGGIWHCEEYD